MSEEDDYERNPELEQAVDDLVDRVHELLNQFDVDGPETQKVVLTLPRAFVELASFLAVVDAEENDPLAFWNYVRTTPDDGSAAKHLNRMRNHYFERTLYETMHLTLHLLATRALELRGKRGL